MNNDRFNLSAPTITPELKKELQILKVLSDVLLQSAYIL